MKDYINTYWQGLLSRHGLTDFDALWAMEADWFEPPNKRRGGWSGVARFELDLPEGGKQGFFLKRQQNHGTFSWRHPIRGIPTFLREFRKIMQYRSHGIPSLEPVYFAMRNPGKDQRAILVTKELAGFVSMEDRVQKWLTQGMPSRTERLSFSYQTASLLRTMHRKGIQHNCFFPKHVFTHTGPDGKIDARVIDLEKSRWRPLAILSARRDLYSLVRQSMQWSTTDRPRFLKHYLGIERLTPYAKWLWRDIERRSIRKDRLRKPSHCLVVKDRKAG